MSRFFVCCGVTGKGGASKGRSTRIDAQEALETYKQGGWERGNSMRKRISLLFVALMLALTMSFGGAALAAPPEEDENPKGNCGPIKNPPPGLVCVKGEGKPHLAPSGQR